MRLNPIDSAKHFEVLVNDVVVAEVKEISFADEDANMKRMGNTYRIVHVNGDVTYAEDLPDVRAKF